MDHIRAIFLFFKIQLLRQHDLSDSGNNFNRRVCGELDEPRLERCSVKQKQKHMISFHISSRDVEVLDGM